MGKMILFFSARWCTACKQLEPILDRAGVNYQKVDVDVVPEMTATYHITSLPTLILLENGEEKGRVIGASELNVEKVLAFVRA